MKTWDEFLDFFASKGANKIPYFGSLKAQWIVNSRVYTIDDQGFIGIDGSMVCVRGTYENCYKVISKFIEAEKELEKFMEKNVV